MKTTIFFMLICTAVFGQQTLIKIDGIKSIEVGGEYGSSGSGMIGFWGAYNGCFRGEILVSKYTNSSSSGTEYTARVTVPIIKQSNNLPINIFADADYTRFQSSGFSSNSYYGAAIVSHQISVNNLIISPFGSIGYVKFSSNGDLKYTFGVDAQVSNFVFGIEHGRIQGFGSTYFSLGYKFGLKQKVSTDSAMDAELQVEQERNAQEAEERDAARLRKEQAQVDSLNRELELAQKQRLEQQRLEQEQAEQRRLEQQRVEQARLEQQQAEQRRLEEQQAEQRRLEQQMAEQNRLDQQEAEQQKLEKEQAGQPIDNNVIPPGVTSGNQFSVQFFASIYDNKTFDNLSHLGTIYIEHVPGQNIYRYKIGFFNSRQEAENIATELKGLGYKGSFVQQSK